MKDTKGMNIQIRLLVEESQQLNSKRWETWKKHKLSANEMIPVSNIYKTKQRTECNILKGEEQEETLEFFSYYLSLV